MLFVIVAHDHPGDGSLRRDNRQAHLDFVAAAGDRVKLGGPLLDDDGETMLGSMLVIEAADLAEAKAWAADDPYRRNGVFESVEIRPFRAVVGTASLE